MYVRVDGQSGLWLYVQYSRVEYKIYQMYVLAVLIEQSLWHRPNSESYL